MSMMIWWFFCLLFLWFGGFRVIMGGAINLMVFWNYSLMLITSIGLFWAMIGNLFMLITTLWAARLLPGVTMFGFLTFVSFGISAGMGCRWCLCGYLILYYSYFLLVMWSMWLWIPLPWAPVGALGWLFVAMSFCEFWPGVSPSIPSFSLGLVWTSVDVGVDWSGTSVVFMVAFQMLHTCALMASFKIIFLGWLFSEFLHDKFWINRMDWLVSPFMGQNNFGIYNIYSCLALFVVVMCLFGIMLMSACYFGSITLQLFMTTMLYSNSHGSGFLFTSFLLLFLVSLAFLLSMSCGVMLGYLLFHWTIWSSWKYWKYEMRQEGGWIGILKINPKQEF